jgi:hypothetical protein
MGIATMHENPAEQNLQSWWMAILSDVHFWVPVIVLLGGLVVLRWIA